MKKALIKDIVVEIWRTKSRFISILLIVMLGTGFFAGVKSTCPDMKETAQKYYTDQNLMDVQLKSTMGLTESDVKILKNQADIDYVSPGYSLDAFFEHNGTGDKVIRVYSYDSQDTINLPTLVDGRFPESKNECVLEAEVREDYDLNLGDTVILSLPEDDITDMVNTQTFQVVGFVTSPMYVKSFEHGRTTIGSGSVGLYGYIPVAAFSYEVYTDIYLSFQDATMPFYEDAYETLINKKVDALKTLATQREKSRRMEIYEEAKAEIDKAQAELDEGIADYEKGKAEFEDEIRTNQNKLAKAKEEIDTNRKTLTDSQNTLNANKAKYEIGLDDYHKSKAQVDSGLAQLNEGKNQLASLSQLVSGVAGVQSAFAQTGLPAGAPLPEDIAGVVEASSALSELTGGQADVKALLTAYLYSQPGSAERVVADAGLTTVLDNINTTIGSQQEELSQKEAELTAAQTQLREAKATLDSTAVQLNNAQAQIDEGLAKLNDGAKDYEKGMSELEKARIEGQQTLNEAKADIDKGTEELLNARHDLNELGSPEWYIFDRTNNPGYEEYVEDALRVDRIAAVFPIFFILVAALVCLTTMTRMVEEQRVQVGTLKSLGYSKSATVSKYIIYALLASTTGALLGLLVGFRLFPTIIFNAYRIMYIMPDLVAPFRWDYAVICFAAAMACTGLAAFGACYKELKETPSALMRPKPPKSGKRVLLERVGFIWNHLSFLQKVMVRNLFRYKKRIYMTLIGIAGCTALLMAGFGLQHSISSIVDRQYDAIFLYDVMGVYNDDITVYERQEINAQIQNNPYISSSVHVRQESVDISGNKGKKKGAYLLVPEDTDALHPFISFQERVSQKPVTIDTDGAVITEKLAKMVDAAVGDTITLYVGDTQQVSLTVSAITENYLMHYVYLSPQQYEAAFGKKMTPNAFLSDMTEPDVETALSTQLMKNNNMLAVNFTSDGGQSFKDIVKSMNYIVVVIIVCAGALAFIVLYNLANINIEERVREIATIKVLGFYDGEVSAYVYRESTISALMGMACGLLLGVPFLRFIIYTAEVDAVMFNPVINIGSYVMAGVMTIFFAMIVNIAMYFRLKKVDMVQSLKSVE